MGGEGLFQVWAWMASFGFLAVLQQFIPPEFLDLIRRSVRKCLRRFLAPDVYCEIPEFINCTTNNLYEDVEIYLSSVPLGEAQYLKITREKDAKSPMTAMNNGQRIEDTFQGATFHWTHDVDERKNATFVNSFESQSDEKRSYTVQVSRKDKERVMDAYMAHIESKAKEVKRRVRDLQLYTNSKGQDYYSRRKVWDSVSFSHPACFETLALDGDMKTKILNDLDRFAGNESFYKSVGKAWKRGYLLFGPPGTGKSSMIAAIANKMHYDVYDLELTEVDSNSELRKLLLRTSNKSIVVIEDIDCSLNLSGQRKKKDEKKKKKEGETPPPPKKESKVTLSGLLNFVDGLWSCCGSERIFIFTTNYVEKLDPALLRPGRMDMHIHLGYCTFSAFQVLAKNYMELTEHELFGKVEKAFEGSFMTPAAVSEFFIENQDNDPEATLEALIVALGEHREDPRLKALAEEEAEGEEEEEEEKDKKTDAKGKADKEKDPAEQKLEKESPEETRSDDLEQVKEVSHDQKAERKVSDDQVPEKVVSNDRVFEKVSDVQELEEKVSDGREMEKRVSDDQELEKKVSDDKEQKKVSVDQGGKKAEVP